MDPAEESAEARGPPQRAKQLFFTRQTLRRGIAGAMKGDHVTTGIEQQARRLFDARGERIERAAMVAGHAQPHDVRRNARRQVAHHLLLHHAVRCWDDQSDTRRHAALPPGGGLREAGLVVASKQGRRRYYQLRPAALTELRDWLEELERFWRERLAALGDYLRETPA